MNRRMFMQSSGLGIMGIFSHPLLGTSDFRIRYGEERSLEEWIQRGLFSSGLEDPADEAAWAGVQQLFPRVESFCQLENGYFSHASLPVRKFQRERQEYIQNRSSYFMRKEQEASIENSRKALAGFFGWDKEELAFTRNTTESLNILISGFPWKAGDEVVIGDQDYGSMDEAFRQQQKRYGIIIKKARVPLRPKTPEEVVNAYLEALGPKTRMLHLTHLINLSGQVIPLEPIIEGARKKNPGLFIVVDAAHSVAHLDTDWKNCNADAVGGSLHKWMCNPIGLGFLYLRKSRIPEIWPLTGDTERAQTDIRRFEHQGTRPVSTIECIEKSIQLHTLMGGVKNKENRLRYLQQSWTQELRRHKKVNILIPEYPGSSCAIATFAVEGYSPEQLADKLWKEDRIFSVAINHPVVQGVRITPHLSNNREDIDLLREAIRKIAG